MLSRWISSKPNPHICAQKTSSRTAFSNSLDFSCLGLATITFPCECAVTQSSLCQCLEASLRVDELMAITSSPTWDILEAYRMYKYDNLIHMKYRSPSLTAK